MAEQSTTAVPGGMAQWYSQETMPPRRERILQIDLMPLLPLVRRLQSGDIESSALSKEEVKSILEVNELAVVVYLKEWTLKDGAGDPLPIPSNVDEVLDLDRPLYDALTVQAAKLLTNMKPDGFSVDAVEDDNSPTEA